MTATIEISLYPLTEAYETIIIDFIKRMEQHSGFNVRVNETSTHCFGDYEAIFDALKQEIARSFEQHGKAVFVMKVLGMDLQVMEEGLSLD